MIRFQGGPATDKRCRNNSLKGHSPQFDMQGTQIRCQNNCSGNPSIFNFRYTTSFKQTVLKDCRGRAVSALASGVEGCGIESRKLTFRRGEKTVRKFPFGITKSFNLSVINCSGGPVVSMVRCGFQGCRIEPRRCFFISEAKMVCYYKTKTITRFAR